MKEMDEAGVRRSRQAGIWEGICTPRRDESRERRGGGQPAPHDSHPTRGAEQATFQAYGPILCRPLVRYNDSAPSRVPPVLVRRGHRPQSYG